MNIKSVEKKENSAVAITIEVNGAEFNEAIEKVYKKQRKSINVPGFRKGHAPRKIIEGMYGTEVFYEDAINESYPAFYEMAIKQENIESVAYTDIQITEMNKDGYTFIATTTVRPEVKMGEYKGLEVPMMPVEVTEEDINNELQPFLNRATRLVAVDRAAQMGDTAVIDFEGFKEGVPFEGGKGEGFSLELGSNSFVPGFEEQVVGMKADDEKDLDITFPEQYHEDLAGKAVVFKVKVVEVKEKETPVLDDEFAKDVSEFETLAEFKASLSETIRGRKEEAAKKGYEDACVAAVVANMEVEVPDAMVEYQAERMLKSYAQRITAQGIPFEQYLEMMGATMEDMKRNAMEGAQEVVRRELALRAVAAAEGIEIAEEEMEAAFAAMAEQYKVSVDEVKANVDAEDIRRDKMDEKALAVVMDSAKPVAPVAVEAEEKTEEKPKKKAAPRKKKVEAEAQAVEGEEKPKKKAAPRKKKVAEPEAETKVEE